MDVLCCDASDSRCLLRNCEKCNNKILTYLPHLKNEIVRKEVWLTEKIDRVSGKTGKDIIVSRTIEKVITESVAETLKIF